MLLYAIVEQSTRIGKNVLLLFVVIVFKISDYENWLEPRWAGHLLLSQSICEIQEFNYS